MNKFLLTAAALTVLSTASAQQKTIPQIAQKDSVTFAEYSKAENLLDYNTRKLIDEHAVKPNWLKDDSFWYSRTTNSKQEFILVKPIDKTRKPAFDHQKLATALSKLTGTSYDASALPIQSIGFSDNL